MRDELGRNWHARLVFTVLARITKKRNHRRYPIGAGASRGIHHDEQLHQMLVGRRAGGLNNENIVAPNIFFDSDVSLGIWERADRRLAKRDADVFADTLGQLAIGRAAKYLQFWLEGKHR